MKETLIMTICGPDKPGTVQGIVRALEASDVEVEGCKVMRFEGQISVIIRCAHSTGNGDGLVSALRSQFPALRFHVSKQVAVVKNEGPVNSIDIEVNCLNRPGLQGELEAIMHDLDFKVEKSDYTRCRVANIGETVFSARYALIVPRNLSGEAVADEIEALADGVRVNFK